jgi:hypothetical protein
MLAAYKVHQYVTFKIPQQILCIFNRPRVKSLYIYITLKVQPFFMYEDDIFYGIHFFFLSLSAKKLFMPILTIGYTASSGSLEVVM